MSRLTSTEIVKKGDYLKPDFNPASLTVSQLIGVLGHHEIKYPTPYSKPRLIQLFNDTIKANVARYTTLTPEPSDDGITDGLTGEPINAPAAPAPARRSSRKSSRQPSHDEDATPVRPEPSKRPRSSAKPRSTSRVSSRTVPEPVVEEETESEEEQPPRKVGRSKKTTDGARRRASHAEDSGWEDNNVFQSEPDTTPVKPKSRRSSAAPRKSKRKSTSVPPEEPISPARSSIPPDTRFAPDLSDEILRENIAAASRWTNRGVSPSGTKVEEEYFTQLNDIDTEDQHEDYDVPDVDQDGMEDYEEEDAQTLAISKRIAAGGQLSTPTKNTGSSFSFTNIVLLLLVFAAGNALVEHKTKLAEIGYCDTGKDSNTFLDKLRLLHDEEEQCRQVAKNESLINPDAIDSCTPPDIFPVLHPLECIPCPQQASCTQHTVACEKGFLLRTYNPFPVTRPVKFVYNEPTPEDYFSKVKVALSNAWPYLGPQCVPDPTREAKIGSLGRAVRLFLAQERGKRLCAGDISKRPTVEEAAGGEAKRWGLEIDLLKKDMQGGLTRPEQNFDETFDQAIQQITSFGDVFISENMVGQRFIAHTTPKMNWDCKITVWLRQLWDAWRNTVLGILAGVSVLVWIKFKQQGQVLENKRVDELVRTTMQILQDMEMAHHTDMVTNPTPYFVKDQLRDFILQDEHVLSKRQRIWEKVAAVVEGNANIRVNQEEVDGGDEVKVWRWVGSARRRSIAAQSPDELLLEDI